MGKEVGFMKTGDWEVLVTLPPFMVIIVSDFWAWIRPFLGPEPMGLGLYITY